jgi:hypothetical protein
MITTVYVATARLHNIDERDAVVVSRHDERQAVLERHPLATRYRPPTAVRKPGVIVVTVLLPALADELLSGDGAERAVGAIVGVDEVDVATAEPRASVCIGR